MNENISAEWAIYAREYFNLVDRYIPALYEDMKNGGDFSKEFHADTMKKFERVYGRLGELETIYPALKTIPVNL